MDILILSNKLPYPLRDGGSLATYNLASSLQKSGNNITILALNTSKHYYNPDEIPQEIFDNIDLKSVYVDTALTVKDAVTNLLFSSFPYNAQRFVTNEYKEELVQLLSKNKYDLIQLEGLYMFPYIDLIRQHSDAKIVMRSHNVEHEIWERNAKQEKQLLKKWYKNNLSKRIKKLETKSLFECDAMVSISDKDLRKFVELGCNLPSTICQSGFFLDNIAKYKTNPDHPTFFSIGALDWSPNQDGLIWFANKVWPNILKINPELTFYIAGRNAPNWFKNKISKPGIKFIGEVENAYDFISSKSIMIVPLFSGSGMRIKIIEGMALGKSIISTSIGAEGINCTDNKNICIANNQHEYLEKCNSLINDLDYYNDISKNASNFVVTNYDNLEIAQKLMLFYKGLF